MLKNVLLSIITVIITLAGGVYIYQTVSANNEQRSEASNLEQARKDCSNKINPRAEDSLVYGEYNQCIASKGFNEFKK